MVFGISAVIACVAINAFPELAISMQGVVGPSIGHSDVLGVLAERSERFGDRDHSADLRVLHSWLAAPRDEFPSMYSLIHGVLGAKWRGEWTTMLLELSPACTVASELQAQWQKRAAEEPPTVLFVRSRVPVAELGRLSVLDLGTRHTCAQDREQARSDHARVAALARTVGVDGNTSAPMVAQSLRALRRWLETSAHPPPRDPVRAALDSDVWPAIIARLHEQLIRTDERRRRAEREPRFVLRAMLVQNDTAAISDGSGTQMCSFSVVRRFGTETGHFSVLDGSGVCRPVRLHGITGTVVESMWVCCADDAECGNTVVADPDDEIFCSTCGGADSWSYDQIVLCDGCEAGVHQMCHDPVVTEDELVADRWFCGACRRTTKRVRTQ